MSDIEYEDEYSYEDEPEESMDWNSADEYSDQEQYSDEDQEESMDRGSAGNAHDYKSHSVGAQMGIRMLPAEQLLPEMQRHLKAVTEILDIHPSAAAVLLREHNWSKELLLEAFYADTEKLLKSSGVYSRCNPQSAIDGDGMCPICYDEVDANNRYTMPCGHWFCMDCWHDFCANAVLEEGATCIRKTCPDASCKEVMTEDEVAVAAPDVLPKFRSFQLRNFVESNSLTRWCPGKGCERVACASSASAMEKENNVAHCEDCASSFCMVCGEEPHSPSGCKALASWMEKCRNESETANWILANTKSCPKCLSRIEKNQGCNHMTCSKCRHEFCWVCMGDWAEHDIYSGGYYKCNKYDAARTEDQSDAARAKRELDRYLHYYKRYHAHAEAQKFARKQLRETESRMVLLQESSDDNRWSDVEFLKSANEQLVECRRVLKYTYVYAYYMDTSDTLMKDRFENHQEMLEKFTEDLSELSEKPLNEMKRADVVNQTRVVDRFMKNILRYVEDGLND